ncbi:MAG: DUF2062 domain-containing protein [Alphaproteobacteria bacterium]|nr:DUF2062 domain-containing protein [Alphaproteobacteria bacterium]
MAQRHSWLQNIGRACKKRLVVPILRSPHPAEYSARGVAIGTMWAMTPLVGIQMWLVSMTWIFYKKVLKKSFSLPLGLAFTWISNVFTLVPIYYVFYVTGQMMMGHWDSISGYSHLKDIIHQTFLFDLSFWEEWALFFKLLLKDWGIAMVVGCLPWMIIGYWLGTHLTMQILKDYAILREKRRLAKLQKHLEELHQ